ncbi:MAG TPA: TetR/AcrR family transcriptional regulator [Thermodesulfobacteriota bacterium]|nr:TetR/AcrR family transcriptional regulator [Thermodesulfobacteriota bacterium]HOC38665.1 TetR/AcrR family transcriptional regulator [Thermodesulfobacteriota bacterium]HQO77169.1 TetR/AcrR family transcriptional regulator [Thermodesulfobacteriota bacterium]
MEKKCLSRKEREKLRQRQEILAVALDLFSEKGYHNVSMCQIAEKAEFAIGTLYKFFENKEDLYKGIVLEQSEIFHDALLRAIEEPNGEIEKLRNYVRTKGEMVRSNLAFIRLYLVESRGVSFNIKAGLDREMRKGYYELLEKLALVFESGIKNGRFKNIAGSFSLAVALDSTANAFLLLWLDAPEHHPYPENPDAILNIFFEGLVPR